MEKENNLPEQPESSQDVVQGEPESSAMGSEKVTEPETERVNETPAEPVKEVIASKEKEVDTPSISADELSLEEKDNDSSEESEEADNVDLKLLESIQLDGSSKKDAYDSLKAVSAMVDMRILDRALKEISTAYDGIHETEKEVAKGVFLEAGNEEADFLFKVDDIDQAYFDLFEKLRSKKQKYFSDLEKSREDNLQKKNLILEKLRELVDGEESTNSIKVLKELQEEWKRIGLIPSAQVKTLWANYHALVDRFYDHRSIYFELKELDRRKNLESKTELCERAEGLSKHKNLKEAINALNELHEEYKHIGPVPNTEQEALWQRFKAASDQVYAKRKDYIDNLKGELSANAEKKQVLGDQAAELANFQSDKISDWNKKTKQLLELQKQWEAIGGLPREKSKHINKQFWSGFKGFFSNKNEFFKALEGQREENLKLKDALLAKALILKESDDWVKTTNEFKKLQEEWREVGPVPDKVSNEIYKKFKKACDDFFERRRANGSVQDKEYEQNLKKKKEVCEMMEAYLNGETIELSEIYELFSKFAQIGFVPRNDIRKIQDRFDKLVARLLSLEDLTSTQKVEIATQLELSKMKGGGGGGFKLDKLEGNIRRKIGEIDSNIGQWKTNLDFFAQSKTADKLRIEFDKKIEEAELEMVELKKQLKLLKQ
ncbi:MAG: hypothetical protein ACJAVY_001112 [Marinoscillum sp.]|jgi:hypothetical protein